MLSWAILKRLPPISVLCKYICTNSFCHFSLVLQFHFMGTEDFLYLLCLRAKFFLNATLIKRSCWHNHYAKLVAFIDICVGTFHIFYHYTSFLIAQEIYATCFLWGHVFTQSLLWFCCKLSVPMLVYLLRECVTCCDRWKKLMNVLCLLLMLSCSPDSGLECSIHIKLV